MCFSRLSVTVSLLRPRDSRFPKKNMDVPMFLTFKGSFL